MTAIKYMCVNPQFENGKIIFNGLDGFLEYCQKKLGVLPETWVRGRGIHTKLPGDNSPDAWKLTLNRVGDKKIIGVVGDLILK